MRQNIYPYTGRPAPSKIIKLGAGFGRGRTISVARLRQNAAMSWPDGPLSDAIRDDKAGGVIARYDSAGPRARSEVRARPGLGTKAGSRTSLGRRLLGGPAFDFGNMGS